MIRVLPVDISGFSGALAQEASARPAYDYNGDVRGEQSRNEKGVPLWQVAVLLKTSESLESVTVKFPSHEPPTFVLMQPVQITGLTVRPIRDKLYFAAQSVTAVAANK